MSMMGIKELLSKILTTPLVIESGISGDWTYRKWSDGTVEIWGTQSGSYAMTTVEGNGFYAPLTTYNFPNNLFINTPVVTCSARTSGSLGNYSVNNVSNTFVNGYWWSTKSTTRTCYVYIYAIGKWK